MKKYNIYKCSLQHMSTELPMAIEKYNIDYNIANRNGVKMGVLAEKIYFESKSKSANIPFCHTMEGQAFGSKVELDYINGNRIVEFPIEKLVDIDKMSVGDLQNDTINVVFEAIEYLKNKSIPVTVNVVGPVTLATSILPIEEVYKGMAKSTNDTKNLFQLIEDFLVEYINKIIDLDVDLLSYADPTGTLDILGAKLYKKVAGPSFLRVLERINFKSDMKIHICPKTSTSLLAVDLIEEDENGRFFGGSCISSDRSISGSRYSVKWKEDIKCSFH
ncbi:MAG: uroporphyrinogen decarboxylase family protein [Senegalia sp. (in: firmicutes)]|uniref:uroporphyrinogen decarboxylase family protein n=1 Tax=Senegalia sp. (in: firmicutes) TaxID=1924098 RepID=UPI003F97FF77